MKLIVSSSIGALGNKGILLKASAGEVSAGKGFVNQIKSMGMGFGWSDKIPKAKYDPTKGMDINMEADGDINTVSGGTITIEVYDGAATVPPTADSSTKPRASLKLVPDAAKPSIDMRAKTTLIEGTDNIFLQTDTLVDIGTTKAKTLVHDDSTSVYSDALTVISGKKNATFMSDEFLYHESPAHLFNLKSGGLLMAHFGTDHKPVAGKPYIAIGSEPAQVASAVVEKAAAYATARTELMTAMRSYHTACQEHTTETGKLNTLNSDIRTIKGDSTLNKETKTSRLTATNKKITEQEPVVAQKLTAVNTAKTTWNEKQTAFNTAATNLATATQTVTGSDIILANGTDASEGMLISDSSVLIGSSDTIGLLSDKTIQISINGKNTGLTVEDKDVTLSDGSSTGKMVIKNGSVSIA